MECKVFRFVFLLYLVSLCACQNRYVQKEVEVDDGQYHPTGDEGQYHPTDDEGRYYPSGEGKYKHIAEEYNHQETRYVNQRSAPQIGNSKNAGRINIGQTDTSGRYVHRDQKYVHQNGKIAGQIKSSQGPTSYIENSNLKDQFKSNSNLEYQYKENPTQQHIRNAQRTTKTKEGNNGQYNSDGTGQYIHQESKYVNDNRKYKHYEVRGQDYVHKEDKYKHNANEYKPAASSNQKQPFQNVQATRFLEPIVVAQPLSLPINEPTSNIFVKSQLDQNRRPVVPKTRSKPTTSKPRRIARPQIFPSYKQYASTTERAQRQLIAKGHGTSGQSGTYVPDGSGQYVHVDNKYVHDDRQYEHTNVGGGQYVHSQEVGDAYKAEKQGIDYYKSGTNTRRNPTKLRVNKPLNNQNQRRLILDNVESDQERIKVLDSITNPAIKTFSGTSETIIEESKKSSDKCNYDSSQNFKIIRKMERLQGNNYHYLYETENCMYAEEKGQPYKQDDKGNVTKAEGIYYYVGPDQVKYTVTYTADDDGFKPSGEHLPTPPPIPPAILRSLEYKKSIGNL